MLRSISAHQLNMIREKEMKKKATHQRGVAQLQAAIEADRLALEESKLAAQKSREEHVRLNLNISLAVEKQARLQQRKQEEYAAAMKNAEEAAVRETFLQPLLHEKHKIAEELRSKRQKLLEDELSFRKPLCLPPIPQRLQEPQQLSEGLMPLFRTGPATPIPSQGSPARIRQAFFIFVD